jgi:hypothetical protein
VQKGLRPLRGRSAALFVKQYSLARFGWIWLDLAGFGWIWLDLAGFGWIFGGVNPGLGAVIDLVDEMLAEGDGPLRDCSVSCHKMP